MKKSQLPGMIKYGNIREALADIAKKVSEKHNAEYRNITEKYGKR